MRVKRMICSIFKIFLNGRSLGSLFRRSLACKHFYFFLPKLMKIKISSPFSWEEEGGGSYANALEEFSSRTICSPFKTIHVFVPYTRKFSSSSGHARSQHPLDFCSFIRNEDSRTDHLMLLINNHCHQDEESGSQHTIHEYSLNCPSYNAILASLHEKGMFASQFLPQS